MTEYVLECSTGELYDTGCQGRMNPSNRFEIKIDKFGNMDIDTHHWNIGLGSNPVSVFKQEIRDNILIPDYLLEVIKTLLNGGNSARDIYHKAIIPAIKQIKEGLKSMADQKNPDATTWKLLISRNEKLEADIITANKKCSDLSDEHSRMKKEVETATRKREEVETATRKREEALNIRQKTYDESSRKVLEADRKIANENRFLKEQHVKLSTEFAEMEYKFKHTLLYNADLREEIRMLRENRTG